MTPLRPTLTRSAVQLRPAITLGLAAACLAQATGCSMRKHIDQRIEKEELRELALHRYDEGVRFVEAGNSELAIERFNRSAEIMPSAAAFYQVGRVRETAEEKDQAILEYLKALELAPDFQDVRVALTGLGLTPPAEGDTEGLVVFTDKARQEAELRLAGVNGQLDEQRRKAAAEEILSRKSTASKNRMPTAEEVKSVLFASATAQEEAMPSATDPAYASNREIILNTHPYHFAAGQRFQKNKQYEAAIEEYRLALEAEPGEMEARLALGDCLLRLERFPQAQFHYMNAMEQHPASPKPVFKMGNYYEGIKRFDLAREYYRQALGRDPNYVEAINNTAALDIRDKNYAAAAAQLEKAVAINPAYTLAWLNLGVSRENAGDKAGALVAYRKYVELGGDQAPQVRVWIQELQ